MDVYIKLIFLHTHFLSPIIRPARHKVHLQLITNRWSSNGWSQHDEAARNARREGMRKLELIKQSLHMRERERGGGREAERSGRSCMYL